MNNRNIRKILETIDAVLPQTQCTQCGFPDCKAYAKALIEGEPHNQCPPGGQGVIDELAQLLGRESLKLNPEHGEYKPKELAVIREAECIGCVKCIKVCPTDAIIGTGKMMHAVLTHDCSGCGLCVPACPMDCIDMVEAEDQTYYSDDWRLSHALREKRLHQAQEKTHQAHQQHVDNKQSMLDDALARAKAKAAKKSS